ncbi:MAG: SRPBCC family protein [Pseudomonadota bacterium]
MKFLKRFLAFIIVVVVLAAAGAYLLPREVSVARSIDIDAPPAEVFAHVNSLQAFAEWSPWGDIDPDMTQSFSGPETGVGNRMEWQSADQRVGSGSQEITESVADTRVATALDFGPMGTADAAFELEPAGQGTRVTWGFTSDLGMNPMARYMGLMMDDWVGGDYERGLENLKAAAEGT